MRKSAAFHFTERSFLNDHISCALVLVWHLVSIGAARQTETDGFLNSAGKQNQSDCGMLDYRPESAPEKDD